MSIQEQSFQGVIFNITYFEEIEEELVEYQLNTPQECIPVVPFFKQENENKLNDFYVSNMIAAKSFDDYFFNIKIRGFPYMVREFIAIHPEWEKLVIKYE